MWAPLNFLVYLALTQTDLEDVRHVHENYNSITGEGYDSGNSDKFYHWGALLCVIALTDAGYIKGLGKPLE